MKLVNPHQHYLEDIPHRIPSKYVNKCGKRLEIHFRLEVKQNCNRADFHEARTCSHTEFHKNPTKKSRPRQTDRRTDQRIRSPHQESFYYFTKNVQELSSNPRQQIRPTSHLLILCHKTEKHNYSKLHSTSQSFLGTRRCIMNTTLMQQTGRMSMYCIPSAH